MNKAHRRIQTSEATTSRRAGFTLLDAVGAITATGLLLSFAAVILSRSFQTHSQALEQFQDTRRAQIACHRFRSDVQSATRCQVEIQGGLLNLRRTDGLIVHYQASDSLTAETGSTSSRTGGAALTRVLLEGDQEVGRESLVLPRVNEIRWIVDREGHLPLVRCKLTMSEGTLEWISRMPLESVTDETGPDNSPEAASQRDGNEP